MRKPIAQILTTLAAAGLFAGCAGKQARVVSSPYANGVAHTEPVNYNGKSYAVRFRFNATLNVYDVTVRGKGRVLGSKPGDQAVVEQVAKSAIRHFACPNGQKGYTVPGTARHAAGSWHMQTRCA